MTTHWEYDEQFPVCEICNRDVLDCECPECPVCGEVGNPACAEQHGMVTFPRLWWSGNYPDYARDEVLRETYENVLDSQWDYVPYDLLPPSASDEMVYCSVCLTMGTRPDALVHSAPECPAYPAYIAYQALKEKRK